MTASPTLPCSPIIEQIPKHGVIFMYGFGLRLQVQNGHLSAEWGVGRDRHKLRLSRVNRNLKRVVVVGSGGFATFDAINWIADVGASLIFLDRRGKLLFASTPTAPSDVRLRRAQSLALENGTALKISRELISQKITGQAAIVHDMLGNALAADAILRFKAEVAEANDIDSVRLREAQAAKLYWSQWATLPIRWPLKDENRVAAHWKVFSSRISPLTLSQRLAANPPNACMNLIHAICEAECRIALIAMGLDPEIGMLHCDAPSRSSLANDLQEILRPKVDSFVLNWIQTERFRKADFWEDRNGNCRIASPLARRLCETADTWRKFAAPAAEWVAQTIWNSRRAPEHKDQSLPTRLTQRRRSEAKGMYLPRPTPALTPERICNGCGRLLKSRNKNCAACASAESSINMRKAAKLGRIATHSVEAEALRARTQRQQAAAIKAWEPSTHPQWLTEEAFLTQVQPALRGSTASEIASALGVSLPYATQIRQGRRRPHPRHWEALAQLVRLPR